MLRKARRVHFVGIGGAGMSGIAELLLNLGFQVSGSDIAESEGVRRLRDLGARVALGHREEQVRGADVVVYSSAIGPDNVEVAAARCGKVPVIRRAEMLAELMRVKYAVAVAGTHGKTTTTSLVASVLSEGGLDPTVVVGGRVNSLGANARLGRGEFLVAEADESDGSFLRLCPSVAVVTTVDAEHLDFYGELDALKRAFLEFVNKVPFYGFSVLCLDEPHVESLLPRLEKKFFTYGLREEADYSASGIAHAGGGVSFTVHRRGEELGRIRLRVPGAHNARNALAALAVGMELEVDFERARRGLEAFSGIERRFQRVGEAAGVLVVDDYGHHPAEIRATLRAAREAHPGRRLVVAFQPHRYTRTHLLGEEFHTSFFEADQLFITPIYPAGERPIEGVDARQILEGVVERGHPDARFVDSLGDLPDALAEAARRGDLVLTLGAGDVWKAGRALLVRLESKVLQR
ncbi:MAG: UDP-N-acetylmuramate--L-alanine ligase [Nitrospinota bacterium]